MSFWYFLECFLIISSDPSLFLYSLSRILLFSNFSYFFVFFLYLVSLSSSFFIVVRNFIFLFWASFTLFILLLFLGFKTYLYFIFFFSSFCSHFLNAKTLAYQIFLEPYNMVCVSPDKKRKKPYNFNSFLLTNLFFSKEKKYKTDDFQRWISRLVYRWRTLRTAIRNANCTTQWIIEILNAHCAMTAMPWHAWSSVFSKPI